MRRRNEAIPFALVPRPKLSPHPPGREHGATGWGEKRQKTPRIFHRRRRRQIGVSGRSPDQSVLVARRKAVLQNTSGPVFGNPFPARAATGWRFVERHIVAVQQNISCPAVGYRCPGVICAEKFRGERQTNSGSHDDQRTIARPETVATRCGGIRVPTSPTGRVRPLTFAGFGRSAEPVTSASAVYTGYYVGIRADCVKSASCQKCEMRLRGVGRTCPDG